MRGPLATRIQHPFGLTLLSMRPRRAAIQETDTWGLGTDLVYSAIHEVMSAGPQSAHFDGETARAALRLRRGLGAGWDVETEVSALFGSGGFMDAFIEGFHEFFGFPDAGRPLLDRNQFRMRLRYHGTRVYDMAEDEVGFGDLPVVFTKRLREEDSQGPGWALRLGLELPMGSAERGFGNGGWDLGVGVLCERSVGRWTYTAAADLIKAADPEAFEESGLALNQLYALQGGLEYRWSDTLSLLAQLVYNPAYSDDFVFEEFGSPMMDLALGCAWDRGPMQMQFAVLEELIADQGPDLGFHWGASWGF